MVAAFSGNGDKLNGGGNAVITNKVTDVLTVHGSTYKSFGSIIILILNRESMIDPRPHCTNFPTLSYLARR